MSEAENPTPDSRTRHKRLLLLALGPLVAVAVAGWIWLLGGRYVDTENAYVKSDIVNISAEVPGRIEAVLVRENEPVTAGQLLVRLNDRDHKVALEDAEAELQKERLTVASLKAAFEQNQSALAAARDDLAYAERQLTRVTDLRRRGAVSETDMEQSQLRVDNARNTLHKLKAALAETRARLGGDPGIAVEDHPRYRAALADYRRARLNLKRTEILAPISGVATKVPSVGVYAASGLPVLTVVATEEAWVEANFKEDQLEKLQPGQPVEVEVDAYPGQRWRAHVDSIGHATGAEFALLPPQNATGNWVKVVQRVPVRIRLEQPTAGPVLRAGMSTHVTVDTGFPERLEPLRGVLQALHLGDVPERGPSPGDGQQANARR